MAVYRVEIDAIFYDLSTEEIFSLRNEPLLVHFESNGVIHKYSYDKFSKLATVRQEFLDFALTIKSDDNSSISSTDTCVAKNYKKAAEIEIKMTTMEPAAFLRLACSLIHPLSENAEMLDSFLDNVALVKSLATPELLPIFTQFVKGRLNGRARTVTTGCETIEDIISELRLNIIRDSSEVLESRLAALRFDHINLTDFSASVEKIADQLINSLMSEGVSKGKANSMAIRQVVETCRHSARNDIIKAILASTSFNSPKEVLAKFRTEIAALKKDQQAASYHQRLQNRGRPVNLNNNYNRFSTS